MQTLGRSVEAAPATESIWLRYCQVEQAHQAFVFTDLLDKAAEASLRPQHVPLTHPPFLALTTLTIYYQRTSDVNPVMLWAAIGFG